MNDFFYNLRYLRRFYDCVFLLLLFDTCKTIEISIDQLIRYSILYVGKFSIFSARILLSSISFPNVHIASYAYLFLQSLNQHFCMHYFVLPSYEGNKKSISFILYPPYTTQDMNMFSYFQARNIERQGTIKSDNARMVIHTYPFLHLYPIIH